MMPPIVLVGIAFVVLMLVRYHWLVWQIERYSIGASWWVVRTKQGAIVADQMTQLWPLSYMLWEVWRWDFSRYIVYQGLYEEMTEWMEREIGRKLSWEEFVAECQTHDANVSPAANAAPAAPPAPSPEPADPSRN